MDDDDQRWINRQRRSYQPAAAAAAAVRTTRQLPSSDAVLNCPACMSLLCLDCQRSAHIRHYRCHFNSHPVPTGADFSSFILWLQVPSIHLLPFLCFPHYLRPLFIPLTLTFFEGEFPSLSVRSLLPFPVEEGPFPFPPSPYK